MTLSSTSHPEFSKKLATVCSRLVYYFSLYIVPASIVFFSAAALFMLNDRYPATSGHALQFRMFTDPGSAHSPDTPLAALKRRELVSTARVLGPPWILVDVPSEPTLGERTIDITSRPTQPIRWIGSAN